MKKSIFIASILLLVGVLVACATRQAPTAGQGPAGQAGGTKAKGTVVSSEMPIDSIVGIGILKLEGTDQAIDTEKATELLPLFKALKALSTDSNTAVDEMTALNLQIRNTMTADQLTAIQNLKISSADVRTLLEANGLQTTGSSSSSNAGSSSQGGMGGPGGGPDGGMMMMAAGASSSTTKQQATPNAIAALATSRKNAGGYNLTFADIIIKLLESKITK